MALAVRGAAPAVLDASSAPDAGEQSDGDGREPDLEDDLDPVDARRHRDADLLGQPGTEQRRHDADDDGQ